MSRRTLTSLSVLAIALGGSPASAQEASEADLRERSAQEEADGGAAPETDPPLAPGERREVPNYDGRPEVDHTDAGDVALWIPRILFSPLYLVTEFVIRRPLGFVMTELERVQAFEWILDFFTFGPDRQAGIFPVALYEFGFSPSVGIYAYWDRFLIDENRISLQGSTWGSDWLSLQVTDRVQLTPQLFVMGRFDAVKRPDRVFRGIGWHATHSERARYQIEQIDAILRLGQRPWRRTTLDYEIGYRSASFENSRWDNDPGVLDRGQVPPGFLTGYNALRFGAAIALDTRPIRELMTGGVRVGLFGQQNVGFGGIATSRWVTWGGSLMLATDVLGNGRVLSLTSEVGFVSLFDRDDPQATIPFTELVEASGDGPLKGFWPGELYGESVVALTLGYVWPVWVWVDAYIRASVGNAFGEHLGDFEFERLRLSFDIGVRPRFKGESMFEIYFGLGTQTFDSGTDVASIRFGIGTMSDLLCLDRQCY